MEAIYFDPQQPSSFGGVSRLTKSVGEDATEWLRGQNAYTLHKPVRRRFKRRKYHVEGIDSLWQADLADFNELSQWNDGYRYVLVVIDVFSKYVFAKPTKSKTAKEVLGVFNMILASQDRKPRRLMTDKGKEFDNDMLKNFCKENGIHYYTSQNPDTKAAVAERVIKTLKGRLYRYFTYKKSWRYLGVLDKIVSAYNQAKHRSIGMAPIEVTNENEAEVRQKLYPDEGPKTIKYKFELADSVRIAREKSVFGKGYKQQWSDEIFKIERRLATDPPVYKLKDFANEVIVGTFYEPELQRVTDTGVYEVDKILETRTRNGKKEFFVSWKGYPSSANSWVTDIL